MSCAVISLSRIGDQMTSTGTKFAYAMDPSRRPYVRLMKVNQT